MIDRFTPKQKLAIYIIVGVFAAIYCSISIVNHYVFHTYGYDLGIYNNILYSYSHFEMNHTPIQQPLVSHAFADHFEPVFFLMSPFSWIFGSYTLVVLQIAFILAGGMGVMQYVKAYTGQKTLAVISLAHFYSIWGIYSALGFDFHNNVTCACLLPWLMFFVHQQKWKQAILFWILMLFTKENMALWTTFVCLGIAFHYFKTPAIRKKMFLLSGLSAVYFVLVVKVLIPHFQTEEGHYIYEGYYAWLGDSPRAMITTLITKPGYVFSMLFESGQPDMLVFGIKSELHFAVLVSGGIFLLYKPQFLLMLVPVYAQKLFHVDFAKWGINYHYSIEFTPVIAIVTALFISGTSMELKYKHLLASGIALITLAFTLNKIDERTSKWYSPDDTRFYERHHYTTRGAVVPKIHEGMDHALSTIPSDGKVSAQGALVPRLAFREVIYHYPTIRDAEYIVLAPQTTYYPQHYDDYRKDLDSLLVSKHWDLTFNNGAVLILTRTDK